MLERKWWFALVIEQRIHHRQRRADEISHPGRLTGTLKPNFAKTYKATVWPRCAIPVLEITATVGFARTARLFLGACIAPASRVCSPPAASRRRGEAKKMTD